MCKAGDICFEEIEGEGNVCTVRVGGIDRCVSEVEEKRNGCMCMWDRHGYRLKNRCNWEDGRKSEWGVCRG